MSSYRVLPVSEETFKRVKTRMNQKTKPHEKTEDFIVKEGLDSLDKETNLVEEIEDEKIEIMFPKKYHY